MGREVVYALVDSEAKSGIEAASALIHGHARAMAKTLGELGSTLNGEVKAFNEAHPGEKARLIIKLAPAGRKPRATEPANA